MDWYERVELNKLYHQAKFDIYHIYSVRENRNVNVLAMRDIQPCGRSNTNQYKDSLFSCESKVTELFQAKFTGGKLAALCAFPVM